MTPIEMNAAMHKFSAMTGHGVDGHGALWGNKTIYLLWYGPIGVINLLLLERVMAGALLLGEAALLALLLTVFLRNDQFVVSLHRVVVKLPLTGRIAKYVFNRMVHQLGGAHSCAALCTTAWISVACTASFMAGGAAAESMLLAAVLTVLAAMTATAAPPIRNARHNLFECVHRYGGWTALGLTFAHTVVTNAPKGTTGAETLAALAHNQSFALVTVLTALVALPWLTLHTSRKVGAEVVAGNFVKLTFPVRGYCKCGSFARISFNLIEWHSFAVALHDPVTCGGTDRVGLLIAATGDWTRRLVDRIAAGRPPARIWIRRVKPPGFMHSIRAYRRSVVVATGAGIAPVLLFVTQSQSQVFIVWIAQDPQNTFSEAASIVQDYPNILIHDTALLGRPDPATLAFDAVRKFDAEAVFCVSNPLSTKRVLSACLARGIPAYGATWDS